MDIIVKLTVEPYDGEPEPDPERVVGFIRDDLAYMHKGNEEIAWRVLGVERV